MFKRFQKRESDQLAKKVRFSAGALYLRLALERSAHDLDAIDLDSYYSPCEKLLSERSRLFLWYGVAVAALYFSHLGVLKEFSLFGFAVDQAAVKHFLLLFLATICFLFALVNAKVTRYNDLFVAIFNRSQGPRKQDLILRYPRIYTPLHFAAWMTGSPRFMYPIKNFPLRVTLSIVLTIPALIVSVIFIFWLVGAVSYELWFNEGGKLSNWSRPIVLASWAIFMSTILIPSVPIRKIVFWHTGLTTLMENFRHRSPARYRHYVSKIVEIEERRGATTFSKFDA